MGKSKQPIVYQQNNGAFMFDATKAHRSQPLLEQHMKVNGSNYASSWLIIMHFKYLMCVTTITH